MKNKSNSSFSYRYGTARLPSPRHSQHRSLSHWYTESTNQRRAWAWRDLIRMEAHESFIRHHVRFWSVALRNILQTYHLITRVATIDGSFSSRIERKSNRSALDRHDFGKKISLSILRLVAVFLPLLIRTIPEWFLFLRLKRSIKRKRNLSNSASLSLSSELILDSFR